jgi:hypothetical protein
VLDAGKGAEHEVQVNVSIPQGSVL